MMETYVKYLELVKMTVGYGISRTATKLYKYTVYIYIILCSSVGLGDEEATFSTYSSMFKSRAHIKKIVSTKIIRKRLAAIGKKKSVGPDGISGEILKLGGEAMIPYLVRLLDVTVNNAAIPSDWKKAIVVPIYNGGDHR
jgi:hypothetical protein